LIIVPLCLSSSQFTQNLLFEDHYQPLIGKSRLKTPFLHNILKLHLRLLLLLLILQECCPYMSSSYQVPFNQLYQLDYHFDFNHAHSLYLHSLYRILKTHNMIHLSSHNRVCDHNVYEAQVYQNFWLLKLHWLHHCSSPYLFYVVVKWVIREKALSQLKLINLLAYLAWCLLRI
jgi:hypothetical protein